MSGPCRTQLFEAQSQLVNIILMLWMCLSHSTTAHHFMYSAFCIKWLLEWLECIHVHVPHCIALKQWHNIGKQYCPKAHTLCNTTYNYKITNLWKFRLNPSSESGQFNGKTHPCFRKVFFFHYQLWWPIEPMSNNFHRNIIICKCWD